MPVFKFPEPAADVEQIEATLEIRVGHEHGRVIVQFLAPVTWFGFKPEQAVTLANLILEHARQIERDRSH